MNLKYIFLTLLLWVLSSNTLLAQTELEWKLAGIPSLKGSTYNRVLGGATGALGGTTSFIDNPATLAQQKYRLGTGATWNWNFTHHQSPIQSENQFHVSDLFLEMHFDLDYLKVGVTNFSFGFATLRQSQQFTIQPKRFGKSISSFYLSQAQFHVNNVKSEEQKAPNYLFDPQNNPLDAGYGYQTKILDYDPKSKTYSLAHDYTNPQNRTLNYSIQTSFTEIPFAIALGFYDQFRIGLGVTMIGQTYKNDFKYHEEHNNIHRNIIDFNRPEIVVKNSDPSSYINIGLQYSLDTNFHFGLSYQSEYTLMLQETFTLPYLSQTVGQTSYIVDPHGSRRATSTYNNLYAKVHHPSITQIAFAYTHHLSSFRLQLVLPNIWNTSFENDIYNKSVPQDFQVRAGIETLWPEYNLAWRIGTQIHNPNDYSYLSLASGISFWANPWNIDLGIQHQRRRYLDFNFLTPDIYNSSLSLNQTQLLITISYFY